METPIKMDDLGVPLFLETPICFICPPREKQVDTNTTNLHHSIYIHIVWNFESLGFWMPETDASITAYSAYSGLPCLHLDWISTIGGLFASKSNRYPQSVCHLFVSEVSRCGRIPVCKKCLQITKCLCIDFINMEFLYSSCTCWYSMSWNPKVLLPTVKHIWCLEQSNDPGRCLKKTCHRPTVALVANWPWRYTCFKFAVSFFSCTSHR